MRLLAGGKAAVLMMSWDLSVDPKIALAHLSAIGSNGVITSMASNSITYPCVGNEKHIGPFFATGFQAFRETAPVRPVSDIQDPDPPHESFVRSYWIDASRPTEDKLVYNNWLGVKDPNDVYILSRGNAVTVTSNNGTISFYAVDKWGRLTDFLLQHTFPSLTVEKIEHPAQPGQVFEIDDYLYVIEPITKRIYRFAVPWDLLKESTRVNPALENIVSYNFNNKYKPSRATVDPTTGRFYVLTENAYIFQIDPREAVKPLYDTPDFSVITEELRGKIRDNAEITGGDIVWTEKGIAASTVGVKKVDPSQGGDLFVIVPVNPTFDPKQASQFPAHRSDLMAMTVSPDNKYLLVASRAESTVTAYQLSKWKEPLANFKYAENPPMGDFELQTLAWIGECES